MRIDLKLLNLRLKNEFKISKTTVSEKETIIAYVGDGIGEGSPSIHYGLTAQELAESFHKLMSKRSSINNQNDFEDFLKSLPANHYALRCALEMAWLDDCACNERLPLNEYLNLERADNIESSLTITSGSEDSLKHQLDNAADFNVIKIKVGFEGDLQFIDSILKYREFNLRLDANGGWSVSQTIEKLRSLAGYQIQFVEQPLTDPTIKDLDKIKTKVDSVIFLDESIMSSDDVVKFAEVIDGANLKLSRLGGIKNTIEIAKLCRNYNLQLLSGCMLESSIGITAAGHLASLFDYFDLDSILLIENDPFWGAHYSGSKLLLPEGIGIGINRNENQDV